jgi:N-methylhydantoinase A
VLKVRSTPRDPAAAVLAGIARSAARPRLHYGSTVATNALLERRGARVLLLHDGRLRGRARDRAAGPPLLYALEPQRPRRSCRAPAASACGSACSPTARPASASMRARSRARVRPSGEAAPTRSPSAVLHSYAPRARATPGRALAGSGCISRCLHRLLREYREYERVATTVVNAYVGPVMTRHLRALEPAAPGRVRVMQSSGGLITARTASAEPVRTILSGPAGGVIGAAERARRAGLRRVVTFDMGAPPPT